MSRRGPSTLPHHILPSPPPSALPPVSATLLSARHYPPSIHEANLGDIRSRPPALATIPGPCPFLARLRAASLLPSLPLKAYYTRAPPHLHSLDAHRFVWSLARHNTTPRLPGRRVLSLHYAYSPGPSIYSPQRLHPCGLSRPCDLAYQHTYLHYRCSAHATPEPSCRTRAPLDLGSAPQAPIISYIRPPLSLSQEARRDDPRHTLADNTHIRAALRPPVTSTLHTLSVPALLVPARGVRRPFRLCAMLSNHTQDQILIIALCASTHGSIHDGRSIIRVQPLPLATATMPLPSHHHRPVMAHPSIYAAQYSTPRTPTLASIIAPPLRTTLRYATLHSSHGTSPLRTTTLRAPPSSFLHFHGSSILA